MNETNNPVIGGALVRSAAVETGKAKGACRVAVYFQGGRGPGKTD